MNILSLGGSVGTDGKELSADVIVVKSFDELKNRSNEAKDRFVVFDFDFVKYGEQVKYRTHGATQAAKYGAKAALVTFYLNFSAW